MEKNFLKRNAEHAKKMMWRLRALKMASKLKKKTNDNNDKTADN